MRIRFFPLPLRAAARLLACGLCICGAAGAVRADHYECVGGAVLVPAKQRCSDGTLPLLIYDPAPPPAASAARKPADPAAGQPGIYGRRSNFGMAPSQTVAESAPPAATEPPDPNARPEPKWYERGNVRMRKPTVPVDRARAEYERAAANKSAAVPPPPKVLQKRPNRKWYEYEY